MRFYLPIFLILSGLLPVQAQFYTIAGKDAEGVPALKTSITTPISLTIDGTGKNIIITEKESHRVRKLSTDGTIRTIAGTGNYKYVTGATYAPNLQLYNPHSIASDKRGNLYIADRNNHCVWILYPSGQIRSFAGRSGSPGTVSNGIEAIWAYLRFPVGVATDTLDNVYIADEGNRALYKVSPAGIISTLNYIGTNGGYAGDGGNIDAAKFSSFSSLATDLEGNLYINDQGNHCIRKVNLSGIVTTFAGTGVAGYTGDGGNANNAQLNLNPYNQLVVDANNNVFIVDGGNHCVRRVDENGIISTYIGNGVAGFSGDGAQANSAQLNTPSAITIDMDGNLYVADYGNARIRKVSQSDQMVHTIAGNGQINYGSGYTGDHMLAYNTSLGAPSGLAHDGKGNIYIADMANHRVRKVDERGIITTFAGTGEAGYTGDGGKAGNATLSSPSGIAVDNDGNVYIADSSNHCIRKINTNGIITTFAGTGVAGYTGDGGQASSAQLNAPFAVMVDYVGEIYIADTYNHCIRKVDANGLISTVAGTGVAGYSGDNVLATMAQLNHPTSVIKDWSGNLYIADRNNHRIRRVTSSGTIYTYAGTGEPGFTGAQIPTQTRLHYPTSLVLRNGTLYYSDAGNHLIRRITNGRLYTYIGSDPGRKIGFKGDYNSFRRSVLMHSPQGLMIDSQGNFYFADQGNNRIRKILSAHGSALMEVSYGNQVMTTNYRHNTKNIYLGNTPLNTPKQATFHIKNRADAKVVFERFEVTGDFRLASDTLREIGSKTDTSFTVTMDASTPGMKTGKIRILGNDGIEFLISGYVGEVGSEHIVYTIAGNRSNAGWKPNGGLAFNASISEMSSMTIDATGNIYIIERGTHRIRKISKSTGTISNFAGTGRPGFSGDGEKATDAQLNDPFGIALDNAGNVLVADTRNGRIRRIDAITGIITTIAGGGDQNNTGEGVLASEAYLGSLYGLATDPQGNIFIALTFSRVIKKIDAVTGKLYTYAGGGAFFGEEKAATKVSLNYPSRIFTDQLGHLYLIDGNRILKIDVNTQKIKTIAGTGVGGFNGDGKPATQTHFWNPRGVAVHTNGDIYIADLSNNRVRKIDANTQIVTTVVGNGFIERTGEGVPALEATPGRIMNVQLDTEGKLYFEDAVHNRIRKVDDGLPNVSIEEGSNVYNRSDTLFFDSTLYKQPIQREFFIKNNQSQKLILSNISVTDGYTILGTVGQEIEAGQSMKITIELTANYIGSNFAKLTIENNQSQKLIVSLLGVVKRLPQTIDFDLGTDSVKVYGDSAFNLNGVASSGLPIIYRSADTDIAIISNDTVFVKNPGRVAITAYQFGDFSSYEPAPEVTRYLTVNKAPQTITFNLGADSTKRWGDAAFKLNATSSANLKISYASSDSKIAQVVDDIVAILGSGTTIITASQEGNFFYAVAPDVAQKLTIVSQVTDLPVQLNAARLLFFPNPVQDVLQIRFENKIITNSKFEVIIHNVQGRIVQQENQTLQDDQLNISMKDLPAGHYLIKIKLDQETLIKRIIKK